MKTKPKASELGREEAKSETQTDGREMKTKWETWRAAKGSSRREEQRASKQLHLAQRWLVLLTVAKCDKGL